MTVIFACLVAFVIALVFQTPLVFSISIALVVGATVYGVYTSPKEKRGPILLFLVIAIPAFLLLFNYY